MRACQPRRLLFTFRSLLVGVGENSSAISCPLLVAGLCIPYHAFLRSSERSQVQFPTYLRVVWGAAWNFSKCAFAKSGCFNFR